MGRRPCFFFQLLLPNKCEHTIEWPNRHWTLGTASACPAAKWGPPKRAAPRADSQSRQNLHPSWATGQVLGNHRQAAPAPPPGPRARSRMRTHRSSGPIATGRSGQHQPAPRRIGDPPRERPHGLKPTPLLSKQAEPAPLLGHWPGAGYSLAGSTCTPPGPLARSWETEKKKNHTRTSSAVIPSNFTARHSHKQGLSPKAKPWLAQLGASSGNPSLHLSRPH